MIRARSLAAAGALLALAACAAERGGAARPSSALERAIVLVERPVEGKPVPISGRTAAPEDRTAVSVHEVAEVDVNSTIEVRVVGSELGTDAAGGAGDAAAADVEDLQLASQRLAGALDAYGRWLDGARALVLAYDRALAAEAAGEAGAYAEFNGMLMESDAQLAQLTAALRAAFSADDAAMAALEPIFLRFELDGLDRFLSDQIESQNRAVEDALEARRATLRLEAFLLAPDQDPRPIHLDHYDSIDERRVATTLGGAFDVDPRELADLVKQTQRVADAANDVRTKKKSLLEAFRTISPRVAANLQALEADLTKLADALRPDALGERIRATETSVRDLLERVDSAAGPDIAAARAQARQAALGELGELSRIFEGARALAEQVRALRGKISRPSLSELAALKDELAAVRVRARAVTADVRQFVQGGGFADVAARVRGALQRSAAASVADFEVKVAAVWQGSDARSRLAEWQDLYDTAVRTAERVEAILAPSASLELPADLSVPDAYEVPLDELADTSIRLRRTEREPGDKVVLRATFTRADGSADPRDFEFDLVRFGYHDSLQPGVVLVRPDRLAGAEEDFEFAPALTWAHAYYPRPDEQAWFDRFCRTLRPSLGVHAILLDFDDDQATEVGLGGTFAIWGDRLQFGAGVNLMAEGDDEGRFYYFIGSSLIPLLQALERDDGSP